MEDWKTFELTEREHNKLEEIIDNDLENKIVIIIYNTNHKKCKKVGTRKK